jgi:anti-anti-sigma regulatory factor
MATTQTHEGVPSEDDVRTARRLRPEVGAEFAFVVVHETRRGTVAWVRGDLDISTAPAFIRQVIDTLNLPLEMLVVDLADVAHIDEHGLAALQVSKKRATMRGVALRFDGLDDETRADLERSS